MLAFSSLFSLYSTYFATLRDIKKLSCSIIFRTITYPYLLYLYGEFQYTHLAKLQISISLLHTPVSPYLLVSLWSLYSIILDLHLPKYSRAQRNYARYFVWVITTHYHLVFSNHTRLYLPRHQPSTLPPPGSRWLCRWANDQVSHLATRRVGKAVFPLQEVFASRICHTSGVRLWSWFTESWIMCFWCHMGSGKQM